MSFRRRRNHIINVKAILDEIASPVRINPRVLLRRNDKLNCIQYKSKKAYSVTNRLLNYSDSTSNQASGFSEF